MKLPRFKYVEPRSIRKACEFLQAPQDEVQIIAGGTDLIMALKNRQKIPKLLVDISGIPGLKEIKYSDKDGLRVGVLATLRHLTAHPVVREKYPVLVQAALSVGTPQIRAMSTIGGNLCQDTCCMYFNRSAMVRQTLEPCHKLGGQVCHVVNASEECWATYAGDVAPALLVLRARVKIAGLRGEKVVPLHELFSCDGKRPHTLRPGQLVTEIQVPAPSPSSGGAYLKLRQRETLDYPLLGVAVNLTMEGEDGICKDASLALTAVDKAPVVVEEANRLKGKKLTHELMQDLTKAAIKRAHPIKDLCDLTATYRRNMVNVYVESATQQALQSVAKQFR
ncbi:MAG: FAD binding domain-containing protein [Deltaproteobacteria bacterium]|nr:FAD binding domain-containing protein [Deltaproteobacteria bacterium]